MASPSSIAARQDFFQRLKPVCVPLSQHALKGVRGPQDIRKLTDLVDELNTVINKQINEDASAMDAKLADYIFFPISYVLRNEVDHPARLTESSLRCTTALIIHGWKSNISPNIVEQLFLLLTFVVGGVPGKNETYDRPEETVLEALKCLSALLNGAGASSAASASLVDAKNIPSLAHTVTVLISNFTGGKSVDIQHYALKATQAVFLNIKDQPALATVLPGVVSNVAKLLSAPASQKTRVLVEAVRTFKIVLVAVLSDVKTTSILVKERLAQTLEDDRQEALSPAWLRATVSQVKLALASVLKLRSNLSEEVRIEVGGLSIVLLDECHATLENCTSILVESAMILDQEAGNRSRMLTSLDDLASIYPELGETIKITVYNWITSLPRAMQSADEMKKQTAISNVSKGMQFVVRLQLDSSTLEEALSLAVRDSVCSLVQQETTRQSVRPVPADLPSLEERGLTKAEATDHLYPAVIMAQEGQTTTRSEILRFLSAVGPTSHQVTMSLEMLENARELQGPPQIASFWLSFELLKGAFSKTSDMDEFLDFSSVTAGSEDTEAALDEIFTYAVSVLDSHHDSLAADWRLEALALEVVAFAASRANEEFRPELIDVLFPIAKFLGSATPLLREHAITTLNILASTCGYTSVSELVIQNADYMLNAVSVRMNMLDITPASTMVLVMMTRLTGPRLIPYLDDVVASIFAALDNYHGYPAFVENMFSVLKEIVYQGAKANNLLLGRRENDSSSHRKPHPKVVDVMDIMQLLNKRGQRKKERDEHNPDTGAIPSHPEQPWGTGEHHSATHSLDDDEEEPIGHSGPGMEADKPPKTPTYVLLEKIASLTQHYLTSPTPTLRKSLLELIGTVSPALSADEDAYLPLVNSTWPVIVPRLSDAEPFVVLAACDALCVLCASAGDFLSSRIKTEWWDGLGKWCRKKHDEAVRKGADVTKAPRGVLPLSEPVSGTDVLVPGRDGGTLTVMRPSSSVSRGTVTGGLGRFASSAQIWEAVVRLLTAILLHVRVEDQIFDEILNLLADRLHRDQEANEALAKVNTDAVWFAAHELGSVDPTCTPMMDGIIFSAVDVVQ